MTKTLGILGGLGPLATVYFANMIVEMTEAEKDQDHIPMVILNDAQIPDRTAYILGESEESPLPKMKEDARKLENAGCDVIVIPCNTAHYFFDEIAKEVRIPLINILEETVKACREQNPGLKKIGVLATRGTIETDSYKRFTDQYGIGYVVPGEEDQASLMNIIYNEVKAGKEVDILEFMRIIGDMVKAGSDAVVLGCTELSIINRDYHLTQRHRNIVDSMEVLARRSIRFCGKKVKGDA